MQTLYNGVQVPTNGDPYNLMDDLAAAFESANVIIQISSQTQRDGLAALAPGGVLPVPTFIYRTDLNRRETWNGVEWLGDVRPRGDQLPAADRRPEQPALGARHGNHRHRPVSLQRVRDDARA